MSTFVRVLATTLVIYSCGAGIASNAWAQSHDDAAVAAKARYKDGRIHYQLGEYHAAIKEFKEAYHLKPDATFLFNIAQCHRQLQEFTEALRLYRNYLRDAQDAPNRDEVEKRIREITPMVAQEKASKSTVTPQPASGAPFFSPSGPTPGADNTLAGLQAFGSIPSAREPMHSAILRGSSTETLVTPTVAAAASQPNADSRPVSPGRAEGDVEVVTRPSDATISVNKTTVGSQSPVKLTLSPGLYSVAIERDGYRSAEGGFSLLAGDHFSVNVVLKPVKSHGWRGLGTTLVVAAILGEGAGIGGHIMANRRMAGSPELHRFSQMETVGQAVAISSVILALGCYALDWLGNRKNVESGPPFILKPVRATP